MPGEVVYDSIIENKNKIKSYWEHLMLAAELAKASQQIPQQHQAQGKTSNNVKVQSPEPSEAEYYDALSTFSVVQTPDLNKHIESIKVTETVVERDIRIQQEREHALVIERQKALKNSKSAGLPMKGGEEIVRAAPHQPACSEEAFLSIPTTDEGNCSESGSEDKDHTPEGSRVMSPVGPVSFHQRTQSFDSISSGHSSGSGNVSQSDMYASRPERKLTYNTVRPLDEPEDPDNLSYIKFEKETPIEKEIRLAREREEELRREKKLNASILTSVPQRNESKKIKEQGGNVANKGTEPSTRSELDQVTSGLVKEVNTKNLMKQTAKQLKTTTNSTLQNGDIKKKSENQVNVDNPKSPIITKAGGACPKIYIQNPQQRGLMKRFLASRGKMGSNPRLNVTTSPTTTVLPTLKTPSSSSLSSHISEPLFSFTSLVQTKDREEPTNIGARPFFKSAEDKIQSELREMKRREEELRQQRKTTNLYLARSQPDLLAIVNDTLDDRQKSLVDDEPTRLPNNSKLRSALSVQNLLDGDDKPALRRLPKRKSPLIEQWESRIKNKN